MNKTIDYELIIREINQKLLPEEKHAFEEWINESDEHLKLFNSIRKYYSGEIELQEIDNQTLTHDWLNLKEKMDSLNTISGSGKKIFMSLLKYAAILILISTIGILWFNKRSPQRTTSSIALVNKKPVVKTKGTVIILSNGNVVAGNKSFSLKEEDGTQVTNTNNKLSYYGNAGNNAVSYNTIKVAHGERFEVVLADGSKVVLNSGSSFTYPTSFSGKNREVTLFGEAFFSVTKNKHQPFVVNAPNVHVEVLGTKFNVLNYVGESYSKTTLVEGKVKIKDRANNPVCSLTPGEQYAYNTISTEGSVQRVNTSVNTAWMEGRIACENEYLESIMKRIGRQFDLSIEFEQSQLKYIKLSADLPAFKDYHKVLYLIEESSGVHMKVVSNKILIYK
ncbi:MAG: FecR family protein [Bacteroidota bacterium]|nr:FecR family protein [Bacteroidota bacterium]